MRWDIQLLEGLVEELEARVKELKMCGNCKNCDIGYGGNVALVTTVCKYKKMPVNRCDSCKHWKLLSRGLYE